jgi:Lon protease-like protein
MDDDLGVWPMFPLGSVVFPGALLPLQVFEPRYLRLLDRVMATEPHEFGTVLIERGNEVGGGDVRTSVGCAVRVVRAAPSGGGRWSLVARGHVRLRVVEWLPDAPHPIARATPWPDEPDARTTGDSTTDHRTAEDAARCFAVVRRALALCAELGEPAAPATVEFDPTAESCSYDLAALAPLGAADRQRLLEAPGHAARIALVEDLVTDGIELLRARLAASG